MKLKEREGKRTAAEAIRTYTNVPATSFVCAHPECGVFALHKWGIVGSVNIPNGSSGVGFRPLGSGFNLRVSQCEACRRETVYVDRMLVWPFGSDAPEPHADMPEDCLVDYKEAMGIAHLSPRGAAALLRLALEKLLPHIGATKKKIDAMIGELVAAGTIPTHLQRALDSVRVIGNEAVHPGEIDLRDDAETVAVLFWLMNFIVEKAIAEPREIDRVYSGLPPSKLAGIAQRDAPKATP